MHLKYISQYWWQQSKQPTEICLKWGILLKILIVSSTHRFWHDKEGRPNLKTKSTEQLFVQEQHNWLAL